ncbi:WXG100 family type VII secretion target [Embleya sp. NBC_00896]|uniref:WXG100 family type VII secretion target n=1 Tax=Embleya sp. NBC_00896 TaxID=2975961 RepID=UPI00386905A4|nr:WXG100 family type VII secretion target [Embleya sp. NBC_00896]
MAGEAFKITPQMLAELSKKVQGVATDLEAAITEMNRKVDAIEGQWQGAARNQFDPLQEQAVQKALGVKRALDAISGAMGSNANSYDHVEQEVGGRISKLMF